MHKKIPKICTGCRVSAAKIYLYHSPEVAKARPHRVGISKNYEKLGHIAKSGKQTVLSRSSGSWVNNALV